MLTRLTKLTRIEPRGPCWPFKHSKPFNYTTKTKNPPVLDGLFAFLLCTNHLNTQEVVLAEFGEERERLRKSCGWTNVGRGCRSVLDRHPDFGVCRERQP